MFRILFAMLFLGLSGIHTETNVVLAETRLERPSTEKRVRDSRNFSKANIKMLQKRLADREEMGRILGKKVILDGVSPQEIYKLQTSFDYTQSHTRLSIEEIKYRLYSLDVQTSSYPVRLPNGIDSQVEWMQKIVALRIATEKLKSRLDSCRELSQLQRIQMNDMPEIVL